MFVAAQAADADERRLPTRRTCHRVCFVCFQVSASRRSLRRRLVAGFALDSVAFRSGKNFPRMA